MEKMFYKDKSIVVDVHNFLIENGKPLAIIFCPDDFKATGNGWNKVKLSRLIPIEYFDSNTKGFMSKTERNKIKERLTLTSAIWTTSDGLDFENVDKAIAHEKEIMENEKNDINAN